MYYRVLPFWRSFDSYWLVYEGENFQPGLIVQIPYGKQKILGIIHWEIILSQGQENYKSDIKSIITSLSDRVFLDRLSLDLVARIAEDYFCPIHHALALFFPKNLLEKLEKGTFEKVQVKEYNYITPHITLSSLQEKIYQEIQSSPKSQKFLLFWVTWSGKTQIYMKCIENNLKKNKQTLVLIPEIILTSQIGERIAEVFWNDVLVLHSGVSAAKKTQYWKDIHSGNAKIIIGTRSALFYPYPNLGMIIMDEEHDESYISENVPRYHASHIAELISEQRNIPLLLASGTPKITSLYKTKTGDFHLLQMLEKYND